MFSSRKIISYYEHLRTDIGAGGISLEAAVDCRAVNLLRFEVMRSLFHAGADRVSSVVGR